MSLQLTMTRDKTGFFFLSVYQADGSTPQSLIGATLYFHAVVASVAIEKFSPSSGIDITNTAGGADCATLTIDPADTVTIPTAGDYQGPCELTLVSGSAYYELAKGTLSISQNVGTP